MTIIKIIDLSINTTFKKLTGNTTLMHNYSKRIKSVNIQ